jgi:hypothetical protein
MQHATDMGIEPRGANMYFPLFSRTMSSDKKNKKKPSGEMALLVDFDYLLSTKCVVQSRQKTFSPKKTGQNDVYT